MTVIYKNNDCQYQLMHSAYNVLSSQRYNCLYQCYCGLGLSKSVLATVSRREFPLVCPITLTLKMIGTQYLRASKRSRVISASCGYFRHTPL